MKLIDADALREHMYHEAFEIDSGLQKWDSGLWIRYQMFESILNTEITINAEPVRHGHWVESSEDGTLFCSECGRPTYDTHDEFKEFMGTKIIALVYPYYCGYCGAKMDEETE